MSLSDAIDHGVSKGLKSSAPTLVNLVMDNLWSHPWYGFIAGAQCRLIEVGMKPGEAWELARKTLSDYVQEDKLTFGDPDYDWGPQGGRDLIQELEIDHWETVA